jgi:hypothetical protein
MEQKDARTGLESTRGDLEQVEVVLDKVVPASLVADDADATAMHQRILELGLCALSSLCVRLSCISLALVRTNPMCMCVCVRASARAPAPHRSPTSPPTRVAPVLPRAPRVRYSVALISSIALYALECLASWPPPVLSHALSLHPTHCILHICPQSANSCTNCSPID